MRRDCFHHAAEARDWRGEDDHIAACGLFLADAFDAKHLCRVFKARFKARGGIVGIEPEIRVQVAGDKLPERTEADDPDCHLLILSRDMN